VEGVDLLAVGPSDLSRSLGVSGQPDHPRLVAAIDRVREAVKKGCRRPTGPCRSITPPFLVTRLSSGALGAGLHQLRPDAGKLACSTLWQAQLSEARKTARVALTARVPPGLREAGPAAALAVFAVLPGNLQRLSSVLPQKILGSRHRSLAVVRCFRFAVIRCFRPPTCQPPRLTPTELPVICEAQSAEAISIGPSATGTGLLRLRLQH